MSRFSELPASSSHDNEHQRALGVAAEEAYRHQQPLLALLRVRQIHDYRKNHPKLSSHFQDKWHAVIHSRDPRCAFDASWHAYAYREAGRELFRRLASDFGLQNTRWTAKPVPAHGSGGHEDDRGRPFDDLMDELSDLDARLNEPKSSSEAVAQTLRNLEGLERRAQKLAPSLDAPRQRMLALYPTSLRLAAGNHRGATTDPFDARALSPGLLEEALESPGPDQDLAIELANRLAVRTLNRLEFDEAWTHLEDLRERFIGKTLWRNEVLGALLGTLGQCYGLLACRDATPALLDDAEAAFREATVHFDDDGAKLRQRVYRLHAAIARVHLQQGTDAHAETEAHLRGCMAEVQEALQRDDLGRLDYAAAAWLKALDALGERPDAALRNRLHQLLKVHAREPERAAASSMAHGLLLGVGWLAIVDGTKAPKWATRLLGHMAETSGPLALLARCFTLELGLAEADAPLDYVLAPLNPKDRSRWEGLLGGTRGDHSMLRRVPFNYV